MTKPRLVVADDHPVVTEGLRRLLEPDFTLAEVVSDGRALVAAAKKHRPDAVVADITMPSLNGIEAAHQMRQAGLTARVIFLTMHRDVAYARQALAAGASGFVLKHAAPAELITAIREALQGRTYVSPLIAGELFQSYQAGASQSQPLTARQREVLQLFAEGHSAKEVAGALKIAVRTAEWHKARIEEVLGVRSTSELVQYAIRNGIISV
jgi:DNA-binding NarL/FixJ family response regulator